MVEIMAAHRIPYTATASIGAPEDLKEKLYEFVFQEGSLEGGDREKILKDCIQKVREKRLRKDEGELLKKIKEAERQPEGRGLEALLTARQDLARKWRSLGK